MADVYQWNGFSGAFNDPNSWTDLSTMPEPTSPAGPPGVEDTAEFITNGTATGSGDVNSLSVIGASMVFTGNITAETFSAVNEGVVDFTNGALINVDAGGLLISNFSSGTVAGATVFGGFVDVQYSDLHVEFQGHIDLTQGSANFTVGEPQFTDIPSTFELDFGGSVTDATGVLGGTSGASASVDGGVWSSSGGLAIGTAGSGTLAISIGGVVSTGSGGALTVGLAHGTSGTVTVSDGGSTLLSNYTSDVVGGQGSGSLTLGPSGTVSVAGTLDFGAASGGSGTIVAAAIGATLSVGSALIIGDGGSGIGTIAAGASASVSNGLMLGSQGGGTGALTVTDEGTQLSVGGGEVIGGGGSGALVVQSGGAVLLNSGSVVVGAEAGGSGTVTVTGSNATLGVGNGLTIGALGTGALVLLSGATIGLAIGTLDLGTDLDASGTIAVSGAGSALTLAADQAIVGDAGVGMLSVGAGALFADPGGTMAIGGSIGGSGTLAVAGSAAQATVGSLVVGSAGDGTLSVGAAGSVTTTQDITIAAGNTSLGLLSVSGAGARLADGGSLVVGERGGGDLIVQSSGSVGVSAGSLVVGDATGSTGDVQLGGSLAIGQGITVGNQGAGTLDLQASAALALAGGTIDVGRAAGGSGTLALAGSGVTLAAPGALVVGDSGTGMVTVGAGDSLDVGAGTLNIGVAGSGVGTVMVTGTDAIASLDGLVVGDAGQGTLTVGAGAEVSTLDDIVIGDGMGAAGSVSVNGAGALLDDGGGLIVGAAGSGEIDINQGSISVFSGALTLGVSATAFGSLSLENSTLDLTGSLVVGAAGSGSLLVGANGTLQAQGLVEIGAQDGGAGSISVSGAGSLLDAAVLAVAGSGDAAGGAGTLSIGAGGTVAGDTVTVWSGGTIALDGGVLATDTITVDGMVTGFGTLGGVIIDDGTILANGGTLLLGSLGGSGTLAFGDPATLVLSAPGSALGMPVTGLNNNDRIELAGLTITGAHVTSPGTVTVTTTGPTYELTAVSFAPGAQQTFVTGTDLATGNAYIQVACFAAGTRIAAPRGEVAVEALCVGDRVTLAEGGSEEVIWVGRRTVDATRHPAPQKIWPVRVAAGAFGAAAPRRDLLLSPDHAVFVENVLIPVRCLINGSTIAQVKVDRVEYYHIELPRHDVVLAEGLPVESYLHTGDRSDFANGGGVVRLYPDFNALAWEALGCARLVMIGPELDAARARLAAIAMHHSSRHRNIAQQCA
jgi:T5SS/PEP-CTERM-associated repeat protein